MHNNLIVLALLFGLLIILELGLRFLLGFGNPLIYITDEEIGYRLAPNQRTRRFGNRIVINDYSMRSPTITPQRLTSSLRVMLLGDSVANGAWWIDQNQTISALMTTQLELSVGKHFKFVEVLNASAKSWGPRNELAYLKSFGTFEAQVVVLLINTDDLFAPAPTSAPVGSDRNYPNRKPLFALAELFQRYFLPAPVVIKMPVIKTEADSVGHNLEAIRQIKILADTANAHFLLAMTPRLWEIGGLGSRDYEVKARMRLGEFIQVEQINYLDFLIKFKNIKTPEALYRDTIHLSPQGNHQVSAEITQALQLLLQ